jgi:putative membrane protein
MPRTAWIAASLVALVALAGCVPAPEPNPAPPAAPPAAEPPPPPPGPPTASSDQEFVNLALTLGAGEAGMGRLAHGKAASPDVRNFAEHMTKEYVEDSKRLEALAKRIKIEPAPPTDQPPPELITSTGPDFDKQYLGLVIKTHQDMISLYESEANGGQDPRLKHYARTTLPALQHHLRLAQELANRLGLSS